MSQYHQRPLVLSQIEPKNYVTVPKPTKIISQSATAISL